MSSKVAPPPGIRKFTLGVWALWACMVATGSIVLGSLASIGAILLAVMKVLAGWSSAVDEVVLFAIVVIGASVFLTFIWGSNILLIGFMKLTGVYT